MCREIKNICSKFQSKTALVAILLLMVASMLRAQEAPEYLLKAGFMVKFAKFTQWPDNDIKHFQTDEFVISVLGENPFKNYLDALYGSNGVAGKKVNIHYISDLDQLLPSHMVYICKNRRPELDDILEELKGKPVLLISDSDGYAEKGVHINLYSTDEGTLHFEVNKNALKESNLRMDILLLEFAKIVDL